MAESLAIIIDDILHFHEHIQDMGMKAAGQQNVLCKMNRFILVNLSKKMYDTTVDIGFKKSTKIRKGAIELFKL